jgi:hypothetical protein
MPRPILLQAYACMTHLRTRRSVILQRLHLHRINDSVLVAVMDDTQLSRRMLPYVQKFDGTPVSQQVQSALDELARRSRAHPGTGKEKELPEMGRSTYGSHKAVSTSRR